MIWRWDQGRTQYFAFDSIRRIAKVLARYNGSNINDIDATFRQDLMANTSLPFAPQNYTVKRNYKRVFECSMLATFVNNHLIISDLCNALAIEDINVSTPNGFLWEVSRRFRYPFPAFKNYQEVRGLYYPFIAMQKLLLSRFIYSTDGEANVHITLNDVGAYLIANSSTGLDYVAYYSNLSPKPFSCDAYSSSDQQRQVREMMIFIGQQSHIVYQDSALYVRNICKEEALRMFEALKPIDSSKEITSASLVDDFVKITRYKQNEVDEGYIDESVASIESFVTREGAKVFTSHLKRERDSKVRKQFILAHPEPVCDCCGINLQHKYPWTVNLLEIHHIWPLSSTEEGRATTLEDLVGLCPSCHRAIHIFYKKYLTLHGENDFIDKADALFAYNEAKHSLESDEN